MPRKITLSCQREREKQSKREKRGRKEWSLYVSCFASIHFKSGHFVAQSWGCCSRTRFPTLPNRAQNPMKPLRRYNGLNRDAWNRTAAYLYEGAFPSDFLTLVSSYSHNNCNTPAFFYSYYIWGKERGRKTHFDFFFFFFGCCFVFCLRNLSHL